MDPAYPDRDHHYPGGPIDLFDAFDRFADFLDGKTPLSWIATTAISAPAALLELRDGRAVTTHEAGVPSGACLRFRTHS